MAHDSNLTNEQNKMVDAVKNGLIVTLQRLATSSNIHFTVDTCRDSLLHKAALYGEFPCVEFLVVKGIDPGVKNEFGNTAFHYCVTGVPFTNERAKIIDLLLLYRLSLEEKNNAGRTLLHQASIHGDPESIRFLLSKGANTHATSNKGATPLHLANKNSKVANACVLLDNGADLVARDIKGRTSLDVAPNQKVAISLLIHKVVTMSGENTRPRQQVNDLNNLALPTDVGNMERADRTPKATRYLDMQCEQCWPSPFSRPGQCRATSNTARSRLLLASEVKKLLGDKKLQSCNHRNSIRPFIHPNSRQQDICTRSTPRKTIEKGSNNGIS